MILHPRQDVKPPGACGTALNVSLTLDPGFHLKNRDCSILGLNVRSQKIVSVSISDALSQSHANLMPNLPTPRLQHKPQAFPLCNAQAGHHDWTGPKFA
jgi:hypothetical protein